VDLSKDRRSGAYCSPAKETGRRTYHFRGKGELRSGKNADRCCGILRRSKPTCPVLKLWVVSLSPTFAGRDLTLCRLKSHMAEELLSCESPTNANSIAENGCRFQKLGSCVSMVEPTKDRKSNNTSEAFDRACVGSILRERNVSSHVR